MIPWFIVAIALIHAFPVRAAGSTDIRQRPGFNCPPGQSWASSTSTGCISPASSTAATPCNGGTQYWSGPSGASCSAVLIAGSPGQTVNVNAGGGSGVGSASFTCQNGAWQGPVAANCTSPCTSAPSSVKTTSCASVAGMVSYAVPAGQTAGTVTYTTETASCTGNLGKVLSSNGASACSAPVAVPTISVSRVPASGAAGTAYTLAWSASNASSVTWSCTGGFAGAGSAPVVGGPTPGTYDLAWVGTTQCVWTANGAGGSTSVTETFAVTAANCGAAVVTWTDANHFYTCTSMAPATVNGGLTLALPNTSGTLVGNGTFQCSNGAFVPVSNTGCKPPLVQNGNCVAQTFSWSDSAFGTWCSATSGSLTSGTTAILIDANPQRFQSTYTVKCSSGVVQPEPPADIGAFFPGNGWLVTTRKGQAVCQFNASQSGAGGH